MSNENMEGAVFNPCNWKRPRA